MPTNRVPHPVILGIVGDSAAGKTTLAAGVAAILGGPDRVALMCTDDYHRCSRAERAVNGLSALDPACNFVDIMEQHIALLRQGRPILKPVYNHSGGTLERPAYVVPKPYIIVDGLLGYTTRAMRDNYDVKVYLDPEEELRVHWKIGRDTKKRGYTEAQVRESLQKRAADSPAFIHPQRKFADIVVRFFRPVGTDDLDQALSVYHILRPTLPHPDLTPLLGDDHTDIRHELTRDDDNKPVDVLRIDGAVGAERTAQVEDLLWSLTPEASHLRQRLAIASDDGDAQVKSRPLTLTQLLVAHHMVQAAKGLYAV